MDTSNILARPTFNRFGQLLLPLILLLAAAVRVGALLSLKGSAYWDFVMLDERVYHTWAVRIANGSLNATSVYEFAPLFPYIVAFIYKLFSPDIHYIRFLNIILGVSSCFIIYLIGKNIANRTKGLVACLIAALYESFIFYSIVPLKTSAAIFLFATAVYLLVISINKATLLKLFFMGAVVGLLWNIRPQFLVIVPILPLAVLWTLHQRKGRVKDHFMVLIGYTVGLVLVISPFAIRNYRVAGEFTVMVSQSGFNLYKSNKLDYPNPANFAISSPFFQGIQYTIEASRQTGTTLTSSQASHYWIRQTLKIAKNHPMAFLKNIGKKALIFCRQFQLTDQYCIPYISQFIPFFKFPFFNFSLIFALGLAGMINSFIVSRKYVSLGIVFFAYALSMIVFFTRTRYRAPEMVILIPFAVMGLDYWIADLSERKWPRVTIYVSLVLVFVIINYMPLQRKDDLTAYHNMHALALSHKGDVDQAVEYWKASSKLEGQYTDFANLSLASTYYFKGDIKNGRYYLDKVSDTSFAAAHKFALQGDMMMFEKKFEQAVAEYEKSLSINSGQVMTRQKLVAVLNRIDPVRARQEYATLQYVISFYGEYAGLFQKMK